MYLLLRVSILVEPRNFVYNLFGTNNSAKIMKMEETITIEEPKNILTFGVSRFETKK